MTPLPAVRRMTCSVVPFSVGAETKQPVEVAVWQIAVFLNRIEKSRLPLSRKWATPSLFGLKLLGTVHWMVHSTLNEVELSPMSTTESLPKQVTPVGQCDVAPSSSMRTVETTVAGYDACVFCVLPGDRAQPSVPTSRFA